MHKKFKGLYQYDSFDFIYLEGTDGIMSESLFRIVLYLTISLEKICLLLHLSIDSVKFHIFWSILGLEFHKKVLLKRTT